MPEAFKILLQAPKLSLDHLTQLEAVRDSDHYALVAPIAFAVNQTKSQAWPTTTAATIEAPIATADQAEARERDTEVRSSNLNGSYARSLRRTL